MSTYQHFLRPHAEAAKTQMAKLEKHIKGVFKFFADALLFETCKYPNET